MFSDGHVPSRSGSTADLGGAERHRAPSRPSGDEVRLQRELDESKHENQRLQEKLTKARSLVLLLQRQVEEARSERDKEIRRSEGLQLSVQKLQRQLKKETSRACQLERHASAPQGETGSAPPRDVHHDDFTPQKQASPRERSVSRSGSRSCSRSNSAAGLQHAVEPDLQVEEPERETTRDNGAVQTAGGMERSWEFVVQGQHDAGEQVDFAPKLISCFPDDAVERAWSRGVACMCSRGRRLDASVPNQDDFLVARHTLAHDGHIALYGVFDGHGPAGHHCAAFARGSLPESLFGQHTLLMKPEDTMRQAFHQTQMGLLQQPFDTQTSGTTAALALVLNIRAAAEQEHLRDENTETWLFVAHVGDSRIILASRREDDQSVFSVTPLTRDHRPDDAEEAERVQRDGGDIRKLHSNSGPVRVFGRGQDRPALALTRSLGASAASECGVIAEPEVSAYRLRCRKNAPERDVLLMLGTDGLFEFCNSHEATSKVLKEGVTSSVLEEICEESRQRWAQSSYNNTVDDITAILATLPCSP